jgi:hypothetical protein
MAAICGYVLHSLHIVFFSCYRGDFTACHINIYKAYAAQVKNASIANFYQLNQPAQILRRGVGIVPQRGERARKRHRKRTKP